MTTKVWKRLSNRPGIEARTWIAALAPACNGKLGDTWGWELQPGCSGPDSTVKGLLRIKNRDWNSTLLQLSGKINDGVRAFFDPLSWEDTPSDFGKKPLIS